MKRPLLAIAFSVSLIPLFAHPAAASPPTNDLVSGAVPATIGFSQALDTTEATASAEDEALGRTCRGPAGPAAATDASVWYSYTARDDAGILVDVSQSNYSAGVYVATGAPGSLSAEACGPQSVAFSARAGTTYYVVAFDDQGDQAGSGGQLRISFSDAPLAPTVDVSIDPTASLDAKTRAVTVSGTLTCTGAGVVHLLGTVNERTGRTTTTGFFRRFMDGQCDGTPHPWTAVARGDSGGFRDGKSTVVAASLACSPSQCAQGYSDRTVRLRSGQK